MDPHDDDEMEMTSDVESTLHEDESHATTGGAAAAGAVTGGVIGLTGGPIGAAIGAVDGAIRELGAGRVVQSGEHTGGAPARLRKHYDPNPPQRPSSIAPPSL